MKLRKVAYEGEYDLAIYGLGFESRSITSYDKYRTSSKYNIGIGYKTHTDCLFYPENRIRFKAHCNDFIEGSDYTISNYLKGILSRFSKSSPQKCLLDITVMSRTRLATIICMLIDLLPKSSSITVVYSLSEFVSPPEGVSPIRVVGEINDQLRGSLGNLSLPTSVVFGLGYEQDKALGVYHYLDTTHTYAFIPQSTEKKFEETVIKNNEALLRSIPKENIFCYNVQSPYTTYLDLKSLILAISDFSRPLLIPLGPKILSALSVIIGKELFPDLPVWRVSSEYDETPTERPSNGTEVRFTIDV